ncbi:VTT domain-containing protein [Flagellimonas flava]|uniref:VTT domain-containing protein n=1 Tax=Flagellimonas flava TaxID=570519 RepID=UPI003D65A75C
MNELIDLIVHTDDALLALVSDNVIKAYLVLFTIILLETGIILFPFLPGDGLLFSAGVITATTELNLYILLPILIVAAISGNIINYRTGALFGGSFRGSNNYFIRAYIAKHLPKAEEFYLKHGGRAIILGRFFPVIRTYIPFVAGLVRMEKRAFFKNTSIGAILWVSLFLCLGNLLGEITWVKNNYGLIFLSLVILTLIPLLVTLLRKSFSKT